MSDAQLAELANAAGLNIDWVDANGRPQRVTPEAQRRLLESLGFPAQSPQQIQGSLAELQHRLSATGPGPLLTVEQGQRLALAGYRAEQSYKLTREDGQVQSGRLDGEGSLPQRRGPVQQAPRLGSHRPVVLAAPPG